MSTWFDGVSAGRVAIVAGGSRGVGRTMTDRLAACGYAVVVNYLHDQEAAESVVETVLAARGTALAVRADVADELDVERLFTETIEAFGGVDAVVHAVARRTTEARVTEVDFEELDVLWRSNVRPLLNVNRAAAQHVRDGGAIVNLSDAVLGAAGQVYGVSGATAAAADVITRLLADELSARGVTVNAVSLVTDRPCAPHRVSAVVEYLLSDDGRALTGRVVRIDESDDPTFPTVPLR
jgi:3-oxoacyl-[acyl-carrier protein] reductase